MRPNTKSPTERKTLDEVRADCKRWRRLVSQCAQTGDLVPSATEEQYKVVHGRILATCRNLTDQESLPEFRRRVALQLDELLRPWSSAKSLTDAPPNLVSDLVKSQTSLEAQLRGPKRNDVVRRLRKLVLTACLAALGGISVVILMQWMSSDAATPLFQSMYGLLTHIAVYLRQTSFTEQFTIAVLLSWLFGTWLLSRLSSS
jgi:hypothetical protein